METNGLIEGWEEGGKWRGERGIKKERRMRRAKREGGRMREREMMMGGRGRRMGREEEVGGKRKRSGRKSK